MSDWVVIPCLLSFQKEFDKINDARDRGAEGFVGDASHTSSSDHTPDEDSDVLRNKDSDHKNEVHAYDCDSTGPWPNTTFDKLFKEAMASEKAKWLDPNDKCRLEYAIWNREIYKRTNDFNPVPYTGSNPHTDHGHFSARYITSCEEDKRPFLTTSGDDMPSSEEIANAVWNRQQINGIGGTQAAYQTLADMAGRTNVIMYDVKSALAELEAMQTVLNEIKTDIDSHVSGILEGEVSKPPTSS